MVREGFRSLGYKYIVLDDCWSSLKRGLDKKLQADPKRFPSGMKVLADYVSLMLGVS